MAESTAPSLVVVESVAKTRTINKILGKGYIVRASVGHVKDLPKRRLGVDVNNGFEAEYITIRGKGKTLRELKKVASTCKDVYIATDPDREGEAIAYHIAQELRNKNGNIRRVLFTEITKDGVTKGMKNPVTIDMDKVEAQKARRVMDRLVGYQVSPLLWKTIYRGLSAGRVQSVALRLICEREAEIEAFVPEEYWTITAELQGRRTDPFLSTLVKISGKKPNIPNERNAQLCVDDLKNKDFIVSAINKKEVYRNPYPPFTTSTLQQEAAKRFGFSAQRTMIIAQQLYEGIELGEQGSVGLITYMRTDSTRIAEEAIFSAREYILNSYGLEYVPKEPRHFKVKKGAQDAHEAIRPTSMAREPKKIGKYLNPEQKKLYELIWHRFVACQMKAALLEQTAIDITADEYLFRTTGTVTKFRGFLQAYEDYEEEVENNSAEQKKTYVPTNLHVGEKLTLLNLIPKQHFTKPPPRYSESTLVKALDNLGIGRPSTYAVIISTIVARKYVERQNRQLHPTELGRTVNNILVRYFPDIFNIKFTSKMEEKLDEIESGKKSAEGVLRSFYDPFSRALQRVDARKSEIRDSLRESTQETCPECGRELVIRWGRNGRFKSCAGWPDCKFARPAEDHLAQDEEICEKCGSPMVVKTGRYGRFLACSSYPDCKNTRSVSIGVQCPREGCGGKVVEKRSRRGKIFYGCSRYPQCNFATWNKPVAQLCTLCGSKYLEERYTQAKGTFLRCPQCKEEFAAESVEE